MLNPRDEILIQRCVDNECSPQERRELIDRLDQIDDGWKTLACTYMEEQLFASACSEERVAVVPVTPAEAVAATPGNWFHHPAVSMVLTACVVFLLGVIGAGEYQRLGQSPESENAPSVAGTAPSTDRREGDTRPRESPASRTVSNQPGSAWLETNGTNPAKVPVYSNVPDFMSSFERFRQQGSQWTENFGPRAPRSRIRYIKVQIGDEILLVPVEELSIEQNLQ